MQTPFKPVHTRLNAEISFNPYERCTLSHVESLFFKVIIRMQQITLPGEYFILVGLGNLINILLQSIFYLIYFLPLFSFLFMSISSDDFHTPHK